jgi:hypothetical protein
MAILKQNKKDGNKRIHPSLNFLIYKNLVLFVWLKVQSKFFYRKYGEHSITFLFRNFI